MSARSKDTAKRRRRGTGKAGRSGADTRRKGPPEWVFWLMLGLMAISVPLAAWLLFTLLTWPDVAELRARDPESTAFIDRYRRERVDRGTMPEVAWRPVPYDRISPHLKRAVIVAEDIGFFSHEGFAVDEIRNAVERALEGGRLRGASTISQQLAKNLWLSPDRTLIRKLKEAVLTHQLETHLSKHRILELYLNVVEFGPGIYGAEAAARRYFGIPAAELTQEQAARLAGVLPNPVDWHPDSDHWRYRGRVDRIRYWMRKADFLWNLI